ncbi:MAG: nicotinate-nucleotide--dimethylbenzimidazole phosphoribosyltransferase [Actinobacteria bacterium]|jgi:nicotinate-nucleotide--dimethylbenzimidazole phosphoribosyltransferase|nr:MAG: nicotinate-nucleotide--dimethylbenzimidazole phosphoribosyltransferase [Actinomycetota bacterium]
MERLASTLRRIGSLDGEAMQAARARQNQLTKPRGALGVLEEISIKIAGITGDPRPAPGRKAVIVMAADHGVVIEGVSLYPSEVTAQMVLNFLAGGAAINVLSRHAGAAVRVVDVGVAVPVEGEGLVSRRIRPGTANMAAGPAMSREEAVAALEVGIEVAEEEIARDVALLAAGDMGIGNTTAASAISACITGLDALEVTGKGTGIDERGLERKVSVIRQALEVNRPDPSDALDVLCKVGGLEIAGMAGVMLAAAAARRPVLVDGFISAAGALAAAALHPHAPDFMLASHLSVERGHAVILDRLGLCPIIQANMRLGEGTGAAMAFFMVDASLKILAEMATFDEAGVSGPEEASPH